VAEGACRGGLCLLTLSSISSYVASDAERLQLLEVTKSICVVIVSHICTQRGGLPALPFVYSSFNQLYAPFYDIVFFSRPDNLFFQLQD
jgi:hypothetical protein